MRYLNRFSLDNCNVQLFLADQKKQQFLHELQPVKELSHLHHLQNLVRATHQPCPSNSSTGSQFALNLRSWLSKLPLSVLPPKSHRSRNILPLLYILVFHSSPPLPSTRLAIHPRTLHVLLPDFAIHLHRIFTGSICLFTCLLPSWLNDLKH